MDQRNGDRSVKGTNFPNFEMLDAKIASSLNKIIHNSYFKKKDSLEEQKAQKECGQEDGDGVPKAGPQKAAAGPRGSRTCVCAITLEQGGTRSGEGQINALPWYRLVGVVQYLQ